MTIREMLSQISAILGSDIEVEDCDGEIVIHTALKCVDGTYNPDSLVIPWEDNDDGA